MHVNNQDSSTLNEHQEIMNILKDAPILKEKMIVDFVNGLEVSNDHLRVRSNREGIFNRFWDSVTGKTFDRQQRIDEQFQRSLETINVWLQRLQMDQIETYQAITSVSDKLIETRMVIRKLTDSHFKLKDEIQFLNDQFNAFAVATDTKLNILSDEISRLGLRQSAMIHLDNVFYAWEAGRKYRAFSPLIQFLLVLEELYWSPFGQYDKINSEFRDQLRDRCIIQLKELTGFNGHSIIPIETWFNQIQSSPNLHKEMILYVVGSPEKKTNVTQSILKAALTDKPYVLEQGIPLVLSPGRLSERLIQERGTVNVKG
jgi:hypothetical protein